MMQDGKDFDDSRSSSIEHAIRKIGEDGAPEARLHFWVKLRMHPDAIERDINSRREFSTKSVTLQLVPVARFQHLGARRGPKNTVRRHSPR